MTDKPVPPLNLIERMAQRLEKEAANQPVSPNVVGRAMERDALDSAPMLKNGNASSVTMREPAPASVPPPIQPMPRGVSAIGPAAAVHTPAVPASRGPEQPVAPPPGKTVHLDF